MGDYSDLYQAILEGNAKKAKEATERALAEGADPNELIDRYMIPAMDEVGRRFECQEYFVPELLIAARAMETALQILTPRLAEGGGRKAGKVIIGTVKGDIHDIGKNLVASMLKGGGFEVLDLGVDVPAEKFVEAVGNQENVIVAMSALLTTTMGYMREVINALKKAGIRDRVKVMIGGAPISQRFADEIGADGYSENASGAVVLARRLLGLASSA
ncbi:MAG: corrinoid protein [Thermoguttaceae bacterium]|nr:corrinoid protein [Thermoguttaceae bacterium]MDW8079649.1 corrinoid protein [Thermoguttaceae bacterium]